MISEIKIREIVADIYNAGYLCYGDDLEGLDELLILLENEGVLTRDQPFTRELAKEDS